MTQFDVFNGDADGLCALHQWRLAHPIESELVTGVKRDIALLRYVSTEENVGENDAVCVLDISLDCNRESLLYLLNKGVKVRWFDHHFSGTVPEYPNLRTHINTAANVCTSLLVNQHLQGAFLSWAVVAAFGDNLHDVATHAAVPLNLRQVQLRQLRHLGECLNYNGYGMMVDDLYFHPAGLYRRMKPFLDPFEFIETDCAFPMLKEGMDNDISRAREIRPEFENTDIALFVLPDKPWSRRVSGLFGNELARAYPSRAHAVAMLFTDGEKREQTT